MAHGSATRGGVLVEFAIGSLLFVLVLLSTLEWGVELFIRTETAEVAATAARSYAMTRERGKALEDGLAGPATFLDICIDDLDVRLFVTITGVDLTSPQAGFDATGAPGDDAATFARVTVTCRWPRITPGLRIILGPHMVHSATVYTRIGA